MLKYYILLILSVFLTALLCFFVGLHYYAYSHRVELALENNFSKLSSKQDISAFTINLNRKDNLQAYVPLAFGEETLKFDSEQKYQITLEDDKIIKKNLQTEQEADIDFERFNKELNPFSNKDLWIRFLKLGDYEVSENNKDAEIIVRTKSSILKEEYLNKIVLEVRELIAPREGDQTIMNLTSTKFEGDFEFELILDSESLELKKINVKSTSEITFNVELSGSEIDKIKESSGKLGTPLPSFEGYYKISNLDITLTYQNIEFKKPIKPFPIILFIDTKLMR